MHVEPILAAGPVMRMAVVSLVALLLVACADPNGAAPSDGAAGGAAQDTSEQQFLPLELDPQQPEAGEQVAIVDIPAQPHRGEFRLERELDGEWEPTFVLFTHHGPGPDGASEPFSVPFDQSAINGDDIGYFSDGPEPLLLPEDLKPGVYRIAAYAEGDPRRQQSEPLTID